MDELARLMDELNVALRARIEASNKTEALAQEVRILPKLSVISLAHLRGSQNNEDNKAAEDLLYKLQLQLELQNLRHAREQALDVIEQALNVVSNIRWAANAVHARSEVRCAELLEDYDTRIHTEKTAFGDAQEKKQEILFMLMKYMSQLEALQNRADALVDTKTKLTS